MARIAERETPASKRGVRRSFDFRRETSVSKASYAWQRSTAPISGRELDGTGANEGLGLFDKRGELQHR